MSGHARQVTPLGPASIAVHDDRDVFREPCGIEMPVYFSFLAVEAGGYFVLQRGHGMRLPQGGRGCNYKEGVMWARGPRPRTLEADPGGAVFGGPCAPHAKDKR